MIEVRSGMRSSLVVIAIAWGVVSSWSVPAVRAAGNKDQVPSAEDLSALAVDWFQWLFGQPVSTNPLFDTTGALAKNGQTGNVFFLGGAFSTFDNPTAASAERTITVPPGKAIFFPVLNAEAANKDTPDAVRTLDELRDLVAENLAGATYFATLDGVPLPVVRINEPTFSYTLAKTKKGNLNIYQYFGLNITGIVDETVFDGYWVYLPPLTKKTTYTLKFGGMLTNGFALDITYHITVQ